MVLIHGATVLFVVVAIVCFLLALEARDGTTNRRLGTTFGIIALVIAAIVGLVA